MVNSRWQKTFGSNKNYQTILRIEHLFYEKKKLYYFCRYKILKNINMRNFILLFATMFATFLLLNLIKELGHLVQVKFISTATEEGSAADVSYFVIDNLMVSMSLSGNTEVGDEGDWDYMEAQMNFDVGTNIMNGLFDINLTKVGYADFDSDGNLHTDNDDHLMMKQVLIWLYR